jgi:hypothetical protein
LLPPPSTSFVLALLHASFLCTLRTIEAIVVTILSTEKLYSHDMSFLTRPFFPFSLHLPRVRHRQHLIASTCSSVSRHLRHLP